MALRLSYHLTRVDECPYRTVATVAWTVGLISLPIISLPLYWVLARNKFHGYREVIREVESRQHESASIIQRELRTEKYARSTTLNTAIEQVADVMDTPLSNAADWELLINGKAFFECLFAEISKATGYVYLEFFIIGMMPSVTNWHNA